jgi:transcription termination factor Rho
MSILDRAALEESPLADLHAIASELSIDSYRRLRRPELIAAILERQGAGDGGEPREPATAAAEGGAADETSEPASSAEFTDVVAEEIHARELESTPTAARRRRGRRGGRGRGGGRPDSGGDGEESREGAEEEREPEGGEQVVEGVVELLPNGSGFMRVNPPEPSEEDVYISAAQVKRCELVPGDRISGPRRAPRRSEKFASLIRVDTINDRPASEVADSARFEDLPAAFAEERFRLGSEDPTIKAIEFLTPFGRGSRVVISGAAQAGKTEALRRLATQLNGQEGVSLLLVLAGVRPEEVGAWTGSGVEPSAVVTLAGSSDAQAQAVERTVDQGRRIAARGGHALVLIDTLDGLSPGAARKALAAARRIVDGGSLTIIATAAAPLGGETTVIALDGGLTATGRFPALDLSGSWTMHAELLVGEAGAEAITRTRAQAMAE